MSLAPNPPAKPSQAAGALTQIRCHNCRLFYPKADGACPDCDTPRRPANVALESQAWQTQLNWHAHHTERY